MTRVTHKTIQQASLSNLQVNLQQMAKLSEQMSTGKKINRPSDDPTGTVTALQLRQDVRANDQYARSTADGVTWLNTLDTALDGTYDSLSSATTLLQTGMNTGVQSITSRSALAAQVDSIRSTLLTLANAKVGDRSVFAGTSGASDAVAVDTTTTPTSYAWELTSGPGVTRRIDATTDIRVDSDGAEVFGDGADSVFALLDTISAQLKNMGTTHTEFGQSLQKLQDATVKVSLARSDVGARTNRVELAQQNAADQKISLTNQLTSVEDIDLPETIVQLQIQNTAYQAALGATAKVLQPSLMDFLR